MNDLTEKLLRSILFQGLQVQDLLFRDIPSEYKERIKDISNPVIENVFSKFVFKYLSFISINIDNDSRYISFIFEYLANFKFIIYDIHHSNISQQLQPPNVNNQQKNSNDSDSNIDTEKFNLIICSEGQCIIIESILISQIQNITNKLKEEKISLINICSDYKIYNAIKSKEEKKSLFNNDEINAHEEIKSFCDEFQQEVLKNEIIKYLLPALIGYLIRRYYYPTNYFKDPSFFFFDDQSKLKEKEIKAKIGEFLKSHNSNTEVKNSQLAEIINEIRQIKNDEKKEIKIRDFNENEFIILRTLYTTEKTSFYFVIHLDTFYTFMMKKIHILEGYEREIDFCIKYHHRCMTKFYGFLTKNKVINGFLYEFQSKGPLSINHITNNIYPLTTVIRLFNSIKYLHSNELIHRDLKPPNILVNHESLPFISDFDRIRSVNNYETNEKETKFTIDFASPFYSSPEQDSGKNISYSTDIFSFGLIIYYLFEKKNLFNDQFAIKSEKYIHPMSKGSTNIQELYEKCVVMSPDKRININEINEFLKEEMKSFLPFEDFILNNTDNDHELEITDFIFEKIMFLIEEEEEDVKQYSILIKQIIYFQILFYISLIQKQNKSNVYYLLGLIYEEGQVVKQDYSKVIKYFQLASNLNNSDALFELGDFYVKGKGVEQNYSEAIRYFELSAKLNNTKALLMLGSIYVNGKGVKPDYLKAIKYYELASDLNNPDAQLILGAFYENGEGVKQDYTKAIKYYELASKHNNSKALLKLGNFYILGTGVKQDYTQAIKYYELASNYNNQNASLYLGHIYENGEGVKQDYSKAIKYYELASNLNNSDAQLILGYFYEIGKGVKQNYTKAIKYYEMAAKLDNSEALFKLGNIYANGEGVKQDYTKAIKYYEMSAQLNNPKALRNLGNIYTNGEMVKRDYLKAIKYYELASKLNDSDSIFNLGYLYENGKGVKQDYAKALNYYELASKYNNQYAFLHLGILFENGKGVKQNIFKAIKYYEMSAKLNNSDALLVLGYFYEIGKGVKQDYSKAIKYYELSANLNNSHALLYLGNIYASGEGVKQDYTKAIKYYEMSANLNNSYALLNLGNIYANVEGFKKDYSKAINYYELSANLKNPQALLILGNIYVNGEIVKRDYLKAIKYYELASKLNNSYALFNLGIIYEHGNGVKQDYLKAIKYYKLASKLNNSYAFLYLGFLYAKGTGVKQDYKKAIKYYELSSKLNNSIAYLNLGFLYSNGKGVEKDFKKALEYYELSSQLNNPRAHFILGVLYSTGNKCNIDIQKSIDYYLKSIKIERGYKKTNCLNDDTQTFEFNNYRYISYNNLGLIYHTILNEHEKGLEYVKESAFAEYPFGQNNYGLFLQFYIKNNVNARHMYERSSEHKFPLAEYNLGYLEEKEGHIEESIKYYIKASNHENEPLIFRGIKFTDEQLNISIIFIICLTNLKLAEYYFLKENYLESKKYFIKAFKKIKFMQNNFSNKKYFILSSFKITPIGKSDILKTDVRNEEEYQQSSKINNEKISIDAKHEISEKVIDIIKKEYKTYNDENEKIIGKEEEINIQNPGKLFDLIMNLKTQTKVDLKKIFKEEIRLIILNMEEILYKPPYLILFGRIKVSKPILNTNMEREDFPLRENLTQDFYDGFGIPLNH